MLPTYVLAAVVAVAVSVPLLVWSLVTRDPVRAHAVANLHRGLEPARTGQNAPAAEPSPGGVAVLARRLLPSAAVRLDRMLTHAGRPPAWPLDRVLSVKLVLPVVLGVLGLVYVLGVRTPVAALIAVAVTAVACFVPELLLHSRVQERRAQIGLALADVLDQVSMAVEAGLGFDAAMARAGRTRTGPLAEELMRTQQDMQVGQSRRQAYEGLADRTAVPELNRFVRAILQADTYGIPVADVLRSQAGEARLKRRQNAEEKAMTIPTKVVFPLMLLILPVMFIVLLAPAVMDIIAAFR